MKLVFHASALADLQNIHNHIAIDNPKIAQVVIGRIKLSLDRLLHFPRSGRNGTVSGTYEVVVPGLPYIVVYELNGERIGVVAVFHGAQHRE
ncbi:MAG: type II toxin-antitoxin system RelE/ParE family toxin [Magnetococcales bacterium]|nr:type II toxin-antitoxin system RelE/ParE family toxin [Magnetococcales bacterium]